MSTQLSVTSDVQVVADLGDYDQLLGMAGLTVAGRTLVDKGMLLGVPHIVTGITFWTPAASKGDTRPGYVSLEATTGSYTHLARAVKLRRVRLYIDGEFEVIRDVDDLPLNPNEAIVYNDESTGIRRWLVECLARAEMIELDRSRVADDANIFDTPWTEWVSFSQARLQKGIAVPSFTTFPDGSPFLLRAPNGLRISQYSNEYTQEGETYYFA